MYTNSSSDDDSKQRRVVIYADAVVPTEYGAIRTIAFRAAMSSPGMQHAPEPIALVVGDIAAQDEVLTRVHSECWTGEVMRSLKCDCGEQFDLALRDIARAGKGVLLYLRQEGRGIGLGNKLRAYALQERGMDTVESNRALGFLDDHRDYSIAALMLAELRVRSVALLTNNPAKVASLEVNGVRVVRRVPMSVTANEHNHGYLLTKNTRMGHMIHFV